MSFRVEAGICRQSREGRDIGGQEQLLVMILQQTTKFHPTSPTPPEVVSKWIEA